MVLSAPDSSTTASCAAIASNLFGALTNGTVLGITVFWLVLYGSGFLLSLLPEPWPSPERQLARLKFVLQGQYNPAVLTQLLVACGGLSLVAAVIGLIGFSKRDV